MINRNELGRAAGQLRHLYDRPDSNVERAQLRRAGSLDDTLASPSFWALVRSASVANELTAGDSIDARRARRLLATLAFAFPAAPARSGREPFGRHLRHTLMPADTKDADLAKGTPRLRRLLGARDEADLAHQLRRILTLTTSKAGGPGASAAGVDWSTLAKDLVRGLTQARVTWSEGFFASDDSDLSDSESSPKGALE